jgi:cytochrome c biogenesis protein CcmG/thiol:disulfide interchange protein DsbE
VHSLPRRSAGAGGIAPSGATINSIAIRDHKEDLAAFLGQYGNPYARIGADDVSAVQLAIGSSGVPETFVIDGKGVIRYQHIGDIRPNRSPTSLPAQGGRMMIARF